MQLTCTLLILLLESKLQNAKFNESYIKAVHMSGFGQNVLKQNDDNSYLKKYIRFCILFI